MTTPMTKPCLLFAPRFACGLILLGACSGGPSEDAVRAQSKLAEEVVQCKSDRSSLKEQLAIAQAEIKRLKEAADPTVKLDPLTLAASNVPRPREGNLPPEAVMKVFKANQAALRSCYERGLKRNPNLQYVNTVRARFAVVNTGNAQGVAFSPHSDGEMERCMGSAIGKWKFPAFTGDPVQFEYPVELVAK